MDKFLLPWFRGKTTPYLLGVFLFFVLKILHAEKIMQVAAEGSDLHCFLCRLLTTPSCTKIWGLFSIREPISSFFRALFPTLYFLQLQQSL